MPREAFPESENAFVGEDVACAVEHACVVKTSAPAVDKLKRLVV
jgi:hypothetical protein